MAISPYHGLVSPYTLLSNIVYFHDWRYVSTGGFEWLGPDDKPVEIRGAEPVPDMHLRYNAIPFGVRLAAQSAQQTEPMITPDKISELFLFGGNIIQEDGRYRLWYDSWPAHDAGNTHLSAGLDLLVRYGESNNGFDWKFPKLGLIEHGGSRQNNIVYGAPLRPETGYHGGCVFRDPSAPPEEQYKAFHLGLVSKVMLEKYLKERPGEADPFMNSRYALFGAVSPDGLHWKPLPEPLVIQNSDTHNVCTYDVLRKKYVAYCRSWFFERRTICRMETDDFRRFPLPEELFWPNAMMEPYDLWYANAKTMMPGTIDYHLMFPMRWNLPEDKFDFYLATSPDGIVWGFVPGGPVCQHGPPGSWNSGLVAPGLGLVTLPDNRMGVLICGSTVPHKYPRRPPLGALGWAWWEKGRLVALQSLLEGSFTLYYLKFQGRTMCLNMRTAMAGYIQVEAVGPDGEIIPGRSFRDCDRLNGDYISRLVTWQSQSDINHPEGAEVVFRFRLRNAELFSVEFK